MGLFDGALEGVTARLNTLTSGNAFAANPLGGANPFTGGSPFQGGNAFGGNPFGNTGSPFQNPFGNVGGAFGNNPFGGGGNIFGTPFGSAQSPFGANPFSGSIANPFNSSPDDPFGTGTSNAIVRATQAKQDTTYGGGVDFSGPATADDNKGLTAEKIDGFIASSRPNSPLKGAGAFILAEANKQGVSVPQLLGIMMLESEMGTTGSLNGYYNYGGLTGNGWAGQTGNTSGMARAFATFNSREAGIAALIGNLASPLYKGKSLQQQIGTWYLGNPNAGLDQADESGNATLRQYLNTVASVYQGLGVGYNPTQAGTPRAGANRGNWEQTALSFTKQGGGWVDYTNGGIRLTGNPKDGFDCSSFTGYVLGLDKNIWNAQAQYDTARQRGTAFTDVSQARKGDLIFFQGTNPDDSTARPVSHVGIYLGNGKMIHTGTPGRGVEIIDLSSMQNHFYSFGRL